MISIAENVLFSKQSLFLAFHRFHRIHGHRGTYSPTGGRTFSIIPFEIRETMEGSRLEGRDTSGAKSQTWAAR